MYRKKILICLNGKDDAQLEMAFIHLQLAHPQHQIMKFHLESIAVEDLSVAYIAGSVGGTQQTEAVLGSVVKAKSHSKVLESQNKNKRQSIFSSSIKELITESQYADMLIIRNTNFYADCSYYGQQKSIYEILKKAGCPVMVIPDQLSKIQQIVLIYDGNTTSLSAIKLLRMVLMPICHTLPITVLMPCSKENTLLSSNEEKMLIEYLRLHFKDLGVHKICEESAHTLHFAIDPHKKVLLVYNKPGQSFPLFMEKEIEKFKQAQDNIYFLFQANVS
ncbi:hypothetical protein OKW21_001265 [Catalinimonas alkaloidigena]|uniref:hypothetical protein n=1 Tax=Catalinimonas alkaloidigena TaxID=1075417 RepID=UPI0024069E0D|nr:hypothetical protein [Catalinimonas alkaloidigena]MDF9796002.1 hypothetical protein [Catalinimonas alkaloidigena]